MPMYDNEQAKARRDWVLKHIVEHGDGRDGIVEKKLTELTKVGSPRMGNIIWKLWKSGLVFFDRRFVNRSRLDAIIRPTGKAIRWYEKNNGDVKLEEPKPEPPPKRTALEKWGEARDKWWREGQDGPRPDMKDFNDD
jgi:hypothetical protein